jgi:hypothetical protein
LTLGEHQEMIKVGIKCRDAYYEEFKCKELHIENGYWYIRMMNDMTKQIPLYQVLYLEYHPCPHI